MRINISWVGLLCVAATTPALAQGSPTGPYPRPAGAYEVDVERSTMVAMRDGVRLATDIYRPKGVSGALPTILIRLPYNKATYRAATVPAEYFASHGYAVAVQDVRG
jgi:predicted acyl esterase